MGWTEHITLRVQRTNIYEVYVGEFEEGEYGRGNVGLIPPSGEAVRNTYSVHIAKFDHQNEILLLLICKSY
jgi:hypothetical protein